MPVKKEVENVNKRYIRINAVSEIYSVKEDVPEDKAENRLIKIRNAFKYLAVKHFDLYPHATLKVTTHILNPPLPFGR